MLSFESNSNTVSKGIGNERMSFNRNINNTTNSITYQTAKDDVLVYFVFSQIYILLMYSLRCWLDMIGLVAIAYVLWQLNDNGHRLSATGK